MKNLTPYCDAGSLMQELENLLSAVESVLIDCREKSLAKTKIEEAILWLSQCQN